MFYKELLFHRLQRQQVIAEDQPVVEQIIAGHAMRGAVRLSGVFQQDARFQARALLFFDSWFDGFAKMP